MNRFFGRLLIVTVFIIGCGGGSEEDNASPNPAINWTAPEGYSPGVAGTGWNGIDVGGIVNSGGKCASPAGGAPMKLPTTGIEYCVKAHPDCQQAGTNCPLYITINTDGAFFSRVDDPVANGKFITVELYTETDGDGVKDKLAEMPRVIAHDYPGLDRERVFAIGWSAGAGAVTRGLCHISKKSDFSMLGTTSDIYAGWVALGGCGCSSDYIPIDGNWFGLTFNGTEDQFNGGDACEMGLRDRAFINGCADPKSSWQPILPEDPYAKNGTGSSNAERLHFGSCSGGEVVGYRGRDEGHVLSFKTHFDPKISGYDTTWNFLQGKTKHGK